jgi:hypothetical protein
MFENGSKWPTRDRPDMIRSFEESIPPAIAYLVRLVDGQLVYERILLGKNNQHQLGGGRDEKNPAVVPEVAVSVEAEASEPAEEE